MITIPTRDEYLQFIKTQLPPNPKVLEVGVEAGHFSKKIWAVLEPSELHLLDPWEVNHFNGKKYSQGHMANVPTAHSNINMMLNIQNEFGQAISTGKVKLHRGYSHELVTNFEDDYFDFVYLDGCHLYESVKQDIYDYITTVKDGGILGGHDYISVERTFVQEGVTYSNQLGYGIKQAVDEFLEEQPDFELIALVSDETPFPDWAIRSKK